MIINQIQQWFKDKQPTACVVGFSEKMDSTVLLHALTSVSQTLKHPSTITAVHAHHGLHPEADHWAQHCQAFCEAMGLACQTILARVDTTPSSLEAQARRARYQAFEEHCPPGSHLLLAHHLDDQAETVLFRLMRGTGIQGASGMRSSQRRGSLQIERPLLSIPQHTLRRYAESNQLTWIEDPSNHDLRHDRNYIRHEILPRMQSRWPNVSDHLAHFAERAGETQALAHQQVRPLYEQACLQPPHPWPYITLHIPALKPLEPPVQSAVIAFWLGEMGVQPHRAAIQQCVNTLLPYQGSRTPSTYLDDVMIRRYRDRLYLINRPFEPVCPHAIEAQPATPWLLGVCLFDDPSFHQDPPKTLRTPHQAERFWWRGHHRSLKYITQTTGIPPWLRPIIPVLVTTSGKTYLPWTSQSQWWYDAPLP